MKNIFNIIRLSLFIVLTHSCMNLDEIVYDEIPMDQFGNSEKEANAIIGPVNRTLKKVWEGGNSIFAASEFTSGVAIKATRRGGDGWEGGVFKEMIQHSWTPMHPRLAHIWQFSFEGIGTCNKLIDIVEQGNMVNKEQVIAEIRGVRAFWYYTLIDNYGNVPIVTDFEDLSIPSTRPRDEVYRFIINELNDIKDLLRDDVSLASYGKFTKGAAYTLLAKMYLNAMIWNPDGGEKWAECIDACNVVMDLDYILEPDWKINFAVNNETSREIILPAVFSEADGGNVIAHQTLHYLDPIALGINIGTANMVIAIPDYVKEFDPSDKRSEWSFLTGPMRDPSTGEILITAHGRPLIHTVDVEMKYDVDSDGWGGVEQEEGARVWKWEIASGLSGPMENDFAIFRLADIYLMKAEALIRSGGDQDEATRLVNEIRKRAFDDHSMLLTNATLEDIYKERRFEFAWEEKTRQDMIRFGTFLDPVPGWREKKSAEYRLLFPIPQTAIDANHNLAQNPGY